MTAFYRYDTDTGLQWVAVSLQDDRLTVVFCSSDGDVLGASLTLDDARAGVSTRGGMLSFGEESLRHTGVPKWVDLFAAAAKAGLTIPNLISRDLQDNYSIRVLVPSSDIDSLRKCNILVYVRPEAVCLADQAAILVSGPLESARLLDCAVAAFKSSPR